MDVARQQLNLATTAQASSTWWNVRVGALVLSTFFPYFGLPAGASSNIPLSTILSFLVLHVALRIPFIFICFLAVLCGPMFLALMITLTGNVIANPLGLAIWPFHVMPLFGFAAILIGSASFPMRPLRLGIGVTIIFAAVQKLYLGMGLIPFLGYYSLPGYASVKDNAEVIVRYIKRPFAFFPEPSFMAGSLALAVVALLILQRHRRSSLQRIDYVLALSAVGVIYLSDSGSGLVSIGLILFALLWPTVHGAWRITLVLGVLGVSAWLGSQVLESRGIAQNYSWSDRSASILGALRYFFSAGDSFLVGAGKGAASSLFREGAIPLDGLLYFNALPDVFSVIARLWLECGLLFGVTLTIGCLALILGQVRNISGRASAAASASLWVLVAGLTISYESAAWIWAFPGIFLGLWAKSVADNATPK